VHVIPSALLKRHDYKIPHYIAASVRDIDFKLLSERGLTTVLIDVDNTLVSFGARVLHSSAVPALQEARDKGYIKTLAIASNSRRDISHIVRALRPDAVFQPIGLVYKPRRAYYRRVLTLLRVEPGQSVMIGDRLIQDVWGARRAGLATVLVKPLGRDLWVDGLLGTRWRERRILRSYLPNHPEHWF
jgi:HAD superfamily phosphatase (TIGR01668 family)